MWKKISTVLLSSVLLGTMTAGLALAKLDVPPAPPLERPIIDQTGTLSDDDIQQLAEMINQSRQEKDYQIGVLMVKALNGEAIEEYGLRVARGWGIGDKENSNGVLLLVAKDDRRLRLEVGYGLEGNLTDARSNQIIQNVIAPKFREDDYAGGIKAGVQEIINIVEGKPTVASEPSKTQSWFELVFLILLLISWASAILGRSKRWWPGGVVGGLGGLFFSFLSQFTVASLIAIPFLIIGGLLLDFFVSKNYKEAVKSKTSPDWWAGGRGPRAGGSSGGGGFGGGGFGGGGASGGW